MTSVNPFFSPSSSDKPWVDQISQTLKKQLAITIDTPPVSIFEIPKTLKEEKLEAYVPQRIGLGPIHHFQPELYQKMEQNKLTSIKRVLKPHQHEDYEVKVVQKVKEIIPIICASYDLYLDADDETLAWLFAIDGLFLIDQLDAYSDHQFAIDAKDFIMLENQLPLIVLKEIKNTLSWGINVQEHDDYWESKFAFFCKSHSPFLLSEKKIDFSRVNHLLDHMYHSIMYNEISISSGVYFTDPESGPSEKDTKQELLDVFIQVIGLIPWTKPFIQIAESFKKHFSESPGTEATVEEIKIPSVSELRNIAGVKFRLTPKNEGIRNVKFVLEKERSCYLPRINVNIDSEVILRNLIAYEKLMASNSLTTGYSLELTEYVDFMCGIIDTAKDVGLLRDEKIIMGDLGDEEIVKLFNGIARSHGKMKIGSELRKTVHQLNEVYESMPRIWVKRMAEKQLRGSAKIITFIISISSTLIFIREMYLKADGSNPPEMMLVHFIKTKLSHFLH